MFSRTEISVEQKQGGENVRKKIKKIGKLILLNFSTQTTSHSLRFRAFLSGVRKRRRLLIISVCNRSRALKGSKNKGVRGDATWVTCIPNAL